MLAGSVAHGDSLGNSGVLGAGDVQWMTAGRGILHQEMPKGDAVGRMHGFQLWANLPSSLKMTAPRYQDVPSAAIPEIVDDDGVSVRVICGDFWGKKGPVDGVAADPRYLDVTVPRGQAQGSSGRDLPPGVRLHLRGLGDFAGAVRNRSACCAKSWSAARKCWCATRSATARSSCSTPATRWSSRRAKQGVRFLLVSGRPLREPIAWHGPIVMNTQAEIRQALTDLRAGTFIKN